MTERHQHPNSLKNLKPFVKGQSGNPGGKTAEHRRAEVQAAEKAAKIALQMVDALGETIDQMSASEVLAMIKADTLKLLKDSQDRGFGTPETRTDHTSSDGSMTGGPTTIVFKAPDAEDLDHGDD